MTRGTENESCINALPGTVSPQPGPKPNMLRHTNDILFYRQTLADLTLRLCRTQTTASCQARPRGCDKHTLEGFCSVPVSIHRQSHNDRNAELPGSPARREPLRGGLPGPPALTLQQPAPQNWRCL